jgi:hypothetical protein
METEKYYKYLEDKYKYIWAIEPEFDKKTSNSEFLLNEYMSILGITSEDLNLDKDQLLSKIREIKLNKILD